MNQTVFTAKAKTEDVTLKAVVISFCNKLCEGFTLFMSKAVLTSRAEIRMKVCGCDFIG